MKGPVELALETRDTNRLGPTQRLSGRVLDPKGQPIVNAVVSFDSYLTRDGGGCGGACEGVDPLAVTDQEGRFLLTAQKPFASMNVEVDARGFAKRKFHKLPSGREHDLRVVEGAMVTGRVLKSGRPLAAVNIGLVSLDRSDDFTGEYLIATNDDGRFALLNVPPNQEYFVYGQMDSLRAHGTLPARSVRVRANGSTLDLGELGVAAGLRLRGQVVLSDGKPVPPHTKVALGRRDAWDTTAAETDAEGRFELTGLYPGSVTVWTRIPGYTASGKNRNLDRLNGNALVGRLDKDLTGLKLLMDPGEFQRPDFNQPGAYSPDAQPADKPLRGAE